MSHQGDERPAARLSRRAALTAAGLGFAFASSARAGPPLGCGTPPCAFGPITSLAQARTALQDILNIALLPFWRRLADASTGEGYDLNHDGQGRWLGPVNPTLVGQARVLWFFAHLHRHGRVVPADAARAERGHAILTERLWDRVHGGFFWEVAAKGYAPTLPDKQLYGQTFGLYALSEHALVTGSPAATAAAGAAFAVIDARCRDAAAANYREFRLRDWSAPPPGRVDYLAGVNGVRTHNTRIHLLEALTTYHELAGTDLVASRLAEVVALTEAALVRAPVFYFRATDGAAPTRQNYGHDIETISLLLRARAQLGLCGDPPAFYRRVVDDALRLGEDKGSGGVFDSGVIGAAADQREKRDWVQAETLLTLCELFRRTRSAARKAAFLRTLDWIGRWQVDWANGSWHGQINRRLQPAGNKAGTWNGPYHTGRAVLGCLRLLDAIAAGEPRGGCTPL